MIKPSRHSAGVAWVARGLSGLLLANLLFGCGTSPSTSSIANDTTQLIAPPSADPANPFSADLASVDIGQQLLDQYDTGHQGFLTAAEAIPFQDASGHITVEFQQIDSNHDGRLTLPELDNYFSNQAGPASGGDVKSQSILLIGGLLVGTLAAGYLTYVGFKGAQEFLHPPRSTSNTTPQDLGMTAENVSFTSDDGTPLKGWFIPAPTATTKTILILHGHGDNKSTFLPELAPWIHKEYNIFTFDFRNSGESGGDTTTLGSLEQKDLHSAIDYLASKGQTRLAALGISMGAATALEEAAGDPRLEAIVSDCAFDTLYDAIESRAAQRHYPLPKEGAWAILKVGDWETHITLENQDPVLHVAQIAPRPILFIHGANDDLTLPEDSQHLYDAFTGPKDLWMVPGAGHAQSYKTAPAEYESRVLAFFDKALT